ncbi:hypothetical protein Tco_0534665 [Tanacetum coccineum]
MMVARTVDSGCGGERGGCWLLAGRDGGWYLWIWADMEGGVVTTCEPICYFLGRVGLDGYSDPWAFLCRYGTKTAFCAQCLCCDDATCKALCEWTVQINQRVIREPGEMAPESLKTVVILKFDMYIYTSTLALKELNQAIKEFCIPEDLRPRLPSPDLTMNKLPGDVIGIYVEQLDQGGMRIPFSTFLLAVIRYFRVHIFRLVPMGVNTVTMFERRAKKCFKEVTSSLKCWKKKFFIIDRRTILDAMPWRHIDTEGCDDFPISYNEYDTDRLVEHIILLRKRPQPLLYMCGLTTDCRHPKLSQKIKDPEGKGNDNEKEDPIPTSKRPPVRTTTLSPVGSALVKANVKWTGEVSLAALKNKKARKNSRPVRSGSEQTIFVAPLNQSIPKPLHKGIGSKQKEVETSVVDLSEHTREPTPQYTDKNQEEDQWLRNDHRISSFRACKELISHLSTPVEDAILNSLSNYELLRRTYQSMGRSILSQAELLKRYEQLNRDHLELFNRHEAC